MNKKGRALLQ